MCEIDSHDVCAVFKQTWHKAAKDHVCFSCGASIQKSTRYMRHFDVFDGNVTTEKICSVCAEVWEEFREDHGFVYTPGSIIQQLSDCIDNSNGKERSRWKWKMRRIDRHRGAA